MLFIINIAYTLDTDTDTGYFPLAVINVSVVGSVVGISGPTAGRRQLFIKRLPKIYFCLVIHYI